MEKTEMVESSKIVNTYSTSSIRKLFATSEPPDTLSAKIIHHESFLSDKAEMFVFTDLSLLKP